MKAVKTIAASTLAVVTMAGAAAFVPMAANAQTATTQTNSNGYGQRNGNGNGQQASLESRAQALHMTTDQLEEKLKTQTITEIAQDQGISTEQYQATMREASAARWQERNLSDEEISERTQAQAERQADCDGTGDHQGQGGFGRGVHAE